MTDWLPPDRLQALADEDVIRRYDTERALAKRAVSDARRAVHAWENSTAETKARLKARGFNPPKGYDDDLAWAKDDLRRAVRHQQFAEDRYQEAVRRCNTQS